jgi:beta-aspartyl-peptidase (threonine type)
MFPTVFFYQAVNSLEDDPTFDAGFGSDLNAAGFVEMDAMIMNGQNLQCGSVAAIRSVRQLLYFLSSFI